MKQHDPVEWALAILLSSFGLMLVALGIGAAVHGS